MQYQYNYNTSSPGQEQKKILASICHPITDTPVTKIRLWASFGVQIRTIDGGHKKNFFNAFPPQKP